LCLENGFICTITTVFQRCSIKNCYGRPFTILLFTRYDNGFTVTPMFSNRCPIKNRSSRLLLYDYSVDTTTVLLLQQCFVNVAQSKTVLVDPLPCHYLVYTTTVFLLQQYFPPLLCQKLFWYTLCYMTSFVATTTVSQLEKHFITNAIFFYASLKLK
jgi:hypothetical protein